jgi:hypothetical protein
MVGDQNQMRLARAFDPVFAPGNGAVDIRPAAGWAP